MHPWEENHSIGRCLWVVRGKARINPDNVMVDSEAVERQPTTKPLDADGDVEGLAMVRSGSRLDLA
jgi:hypothetical protein